MKSGAARSYFRSRRSASGPTEVRNDRLKEVLLRDKPEVIRLRPKHFFPLLNRGKKVYPFQPRTVPFGRDYGPWTNIHSRLTPLFTVHCFSFQPLPSLPFLTPPTILLFSILLLLSFVSFVDTRLSRWLQEQSLSTTSSYSLLLFVPLLLGRLIIRMIPLEPFLVSSMLPRLAMVLIIIVGRIPVVEDSSFQDPSKMINNCSSVFKRFFLARLNIPYYSFFFLYSILYLISSQRRDNVTIN